jgi:hypothetical protein
LPNCFRYHLIYQLVFFYFLFNFLLRL